MKPIFAVVALLGFFERCQHDFPVPNEEPGQPHGAGHSAPQAGAPAQDRDAGRPDPDDPDEIDAGSPKPTAACKGPPLLYADDDCCKLEAGVQPYRPNYELWSDGSNKERFIYLPPGKTIDTSNPDRWNFPNGTRLYKTFSLHGKKLETRVLVKTKDAASIESWTTVAYQWSEDQRTATEVDAMGAQNVLGTSHDIPTKAQCVTCHSMKGADGVNGFGALQLNHGRGGVNLRALIEEGLLTNGTNPQPNVTLENARLPGDASAQAGLGYLHANCGHCHGGDAPRAGLSLWAKVGMTSVTLSPVYTTASCKCLERWTRERPKNQGLYELRIVPGDSGHSGILGRMSNRVLGEQMPSIGSELEDEIGKDIVADFIDALDPRECAVQPDCSKWPEPPPPAGMSGGGMGGTGGSAMKP